MSSLRSNLRALKMGLRKPRLISSSLHPLSVNLNLSRNASRLSWSSFVRILEIHGSFCESMEYLVGVVRCSIEILVCLSWTGAYFDIQYVWVFESFACVHCGIQECDLLGWSRACESLEITEAVLSLKEVSYIMCRCLLLYHVPIFCETAWVLILLLCGEFLDSDFRIWHSGMSHIPGDGIAPMEAPIVWW